MKKLIYLIVAIVALGLIVSGCLPVVPPSEQGESVTLPNKSPSVLEVPTIAYPTIQAAINVAAPGDTINVAAGTYPENVTIPPGKNGLQLIGAGSGVTSIAPTGGRPVTLLGWVGLIDGFRIQGFTLVTAGASHAFLAGSGTADGTTYTMNLEFEDIVVNGGQRGIGLNAVQGVTFDNVHLSNISGSPEAALELTGVSDLTFMGGSIEWNDIGVRLQISPGPWGDYGPNGNIQIHCSSLTDNTIAVENQDSETTIYATQNWWGDVSGPSGSGSGSGDAVSDYVDYEPWSFTPDPCEAKTMGFWKNHEESVVALLVEYGIIAIGDYDVEDFDDAWEVFKNAKNKNANTMLAAQLLAAKLNVAHLDHLVIEYCESVDEYIDAADEFLSDHGYLGPDNPGEVKGKDKQPANCIKDQLELFNTGGCPVTGLCTT